MKGRMRNISGGVERDGKVDRKYLTREYYAERVLCQKRRNLNKEELSTS